MTTTEECFRTLDLAPGASLEQIKQAYGDLVQIWHPDRFQHSSRLREKTEERLREINISYAQLVSTFSRSGYGSNPHPVKPTAAAASTGAAPEEEDTNTFPQEEASPAIRIRPWVGWLWLAGGVLLIGVSFRDPGPQDSIREVTEYQPTIPRAQPVFAPAEEYRPASVSEPPAGPSLPCDPAAFTEGFVTALGSDDIDKPLAYYADTVTYFGQAHVDRKLIGLDIEHDLEKWSNRTYKIVNGPDAWAVRGGWVVAFDMGYALSNGRLATRGTLAMHLRLANEAQSFKITEVEARVLLTRSAMNLSRRRHARPSSAGFSENPRSQSLAGNSILQNHDTSYLPAGR